MNPNDGTIVLALYRPYFYYRVDRSEEVQGHVI